MQPLSGATGGLPNDRTRYENSAISGERKHILSTQLATQTASASHSDTFQFQADDFSSRAIPAISVPDHHGGRVQDQPRPVAVQQNKKVAGNNASQMNHIPAADLKNSFYDLEILKNILIGSGMQETESMVLELASMIDERDKELLVWRKAYEQEVQKSQLSAAQQHQALVAEMKQMQADLAEKTSAFERRASRIEADLAEREAELRTQVRKVAGDVKAQSTASHAMNTEMKTSLSSIEGRLRRSLESLSQTFGALGSQQPASDTIATPAAQH